MGIEQPRLHAGKQLLNRQQGMKLGGVEPKARELVHLSLLLVVGVAVALAVVDDGGVEVQAHVLDDALDRGP